VKPNDIYFMLQTDCEATINIFNQSLNSILLLYIRLRHTLKKVYKQCLRGVLTLVGWVIRDIYYMLNLQKHALFPCRIVLYCFFPSKSSTYMSVPNLHCMVYAPIKRGRNFVYSTCKNSGTMMYRQSDTYCHNRKTKHCNSHYAYCQLLSAYCNMRI
jgi:hypothetical protein